MDQFGIGTAVLGAARVYFLSARATGRTTALVESVKNGDRIIFDDIREAKRVESLCLKRGVAVECVVIDPRTPERVFERGTPEGRTIFDHSWVEKWYIRAIEHAGRGLRRLETEASGGCRTAPRETIQFTRESEKWRF